MSIFYVSTTGSNTSPYDTWAKAANVPNTVLAYISLNPGTHTIYIAAGTYTTTGLGAALAFTSANMSNVTIYGAGKETTIITTTDTSACRFATAAATGVVVNDITFIGNGTGSAIYMLVAGSAAIFNDCDFKMDVGSTGITCRITANDSVTYNRCRFFFHGGNNVEYAGTAAGTFNNCIGLRNTSSKTGSYYGKWYFTQTGTVTLNYCNILDSQNVSLHSNNANAVVVANNCIIGGACEVLTDYSVREQTGSITLNNCLVVPNPYYVTKITTGSTNNSCVEGGEPRYVNPLRNGYILPIIDDCASYTTVLAVESLLAAKGMKGCWAVEAGKIDQVGYATATQIKAVISRGVIEVACHSRSHPNFASTHALTFTKVGGAVVFDGTTITCKDAPGGGVDQTYIVTDKTLEDIKTAMNGVAGWTVDYSITGGQVQAQSACLASSLNTLVETPAPCDIDFLMTDSTEGFYYDEVTSAKADMVSLLNVTDPQTGLPYACNTFVMPYTFTTAGAITAISDAGFLFHRGSGSTRNLEYLYLPNMPSNGATFDAVDEASYRMAGKAVGFAMAQSGYVIAPYGHTILADLGDTEWGYMIDEWAQIQNLIVTSPQLFTDIVINGGDWTDAGGGYYTRSWPLATIINTNGMKLKNDSPCRDVGKTGLGIATDFKNNPREMGSAPDIGAYEFPVPSPMGLTPGLGLGGRMIPPWRRRR